MPSHLFQSFTQSVNYRQMLIINFINLWRKRSLYFRIWVENVAESHHLVFYVVEVNLWFCLPIIWTIFSLIYLTSAIFFSFPKRNNLPISFIDPQKPLLIVLRLLNVMAIDFDSIRMHLKSKLPVLLSQFQIRAIFLKMHNLVAIVNFYHYASIMN